MAGTGLTLIAGAVALGDVSYDELWLDYLSIGGHRSLSAMRRSIGSNHISAFEHNLIAHAMNERLRDRGQSDFPVAYRNEPTEQ